MENDVIVINNSHIKKTIKKKPFRVKLRHLVGLEVTSSMCLLWRHQVASSCMARCCCSNLSSCTWSPSPSPRSFSPSSWWWRSPSVPGTGWWCWQSSSASAPTWLLWPSSTNTSVSTEFLFFFLYIFLMKFLVCFQKVLITSDFKWH